MTTKKIITLTDAQEKRLVEFREEWRKIGLCCDPADFATGDEVIHGFYRRLNKPEPLILHFSSPAMCELAVNFVFGILKAEPSQLYSQISSQLSSQLYSHLHSQLYSQISSQLYSQLRSQLYSQISSQLYSQLSSLLRSQLDSQLSSQLYSHLHSQLYSQISSQLYSQLSSQLYSQLDSQLDSQLRSQLYSQIGKLRPFFLNNLWGSQHWCAWEAFYLFGHEIGVRYRAEDIALLLEWGRLSKSIGWWAPWDGICFVSDRPRHVQFDDAQRLHSENGMAVQYADGWGVHSWHGVRVPAEWIEHKESLTAAIALKQENAELRRAACEIVTWERILSQLSAIVIDSDGDPEIGTLLRVDLPDAPQEQFLRVQCGTGRIFALPVPPDMRTAIQAQAWLWGLDVKDFQKPEVRT